MTSGNRQRNTCKSTRGYSRRCKKGNKTPIIETYKDIVLRFYGIWVLFVSFQ